MSGPVKQAAPGCIVEYIQSNHPIQAWVMEQTSGQLRLYSVNKREIKMAANRVLPWIGPEYKLGLNRSEIEAKLESSKEWREKYASELNMDEIWELAQGEIKEAEVSWFADLIWANPDADQVAGMAHALLADKIRFKFNPPFFEIFDRDEVEIRLKKQEEEEKRQALVAMGTNFFQALYESAMAGNVIRQDLIPPAQISDALKEIIMRRVLDPDGNDQDPVWKILTKGITFKNSFEDQHLPVLMALAWGLLKPHHNFWLDRADYDSNSEWFNEFLGDISATSDLIRERINTAAGQELKGSAHSYISIDPSTTKDFDDAFSVNKHEDGYSLSVALACPALGWKFGSNFDRAILKRSTSLYLPEGDLYMLPEEFCLESFSLVAGKIRPSLILDVELDFDANIVSLEPRLDFIKTTANLSQQDAELVLGKSENSEKHTQNDCLSELEKIVAGEMDEETDSVKDCDSPDDTILIDKPKSAPNNPAKAHIGSLNVALELAKKLQLKRIEGGAVITERPDLSIKAQLASTQDAVVSVEVGAAIPNCLLIVGEIMILINSALASWSSERKIPIIYRTQDITIPKEFSGVWTKEEDIARVLKGMSPSLLDTSPRPHAGVGLKTYSCFTAPMRRYTDLLNEAQIISYLEDGEPQFNQEQLDKLMPLINVYSEKVGKVQRFRPRYWKLQYVLQEEQKEKGNLKYWQGVVIDENHSLVSVMLPELQIMQRGPKSLFGDKIFLGARVGVRLGKVNPLKNEIQIMEILQE